MEDRITHGTDAHVNDPDEDPTEHLGEIIPDPWNDPKQTDWVIELLSGVV